MTTAQWWISVIGMLITIIGVFFAAIQVHYLKQQMQKQNDWNKKNATFLYIEQWIKKHKEINDNIFSIMATNKSIIKNPKHFLDENKFKIFNIVSYFEYLAIGINENYFDEKVTRLMLYNVIIQTFNNLNAINYFEYRQNETGREVGSHFRQLAEKWIQ